MTRDTNTESNNKPIKLFKQIFSANNINDIPTITMMFRFGKYEKVYTKDFIKRFKQFLPKPETKISKPVLCKEIMCTRCDKDSLSIYLPKNNVLLCRECLKSVISKTMDQRATFFNKENFINRECKHLN